MEKPMQRIRTLAAVIASLAAGLAFAADTPKEPEKKKELEPVREAIAQQDWAQARELARTAVQRAPGSADAHNLYAYSLRRGANPPMDLVSLHYNAALRLNPSHVGAHEYLAEAYLMTGNLGKAREHLAILERLCGACDESRQLARSVANAERQSAAK